MKDHLFNYKDLIDFATAILTKAGLHNERAIIVARTLMEADLMGHTTHGLQLLKPYVGELEKGSMRKSGEPEVINDRGCAITWNGKYLPGPWLVHTAIDEALKRIGEFPVVSVAIQRSHHIGCLAAYPERATKKGLMMMLTCSDPRSKTIAPYGGLRPVYSPNPLAAGIPTETEPIILDVSMSATANGLVMRSRKEGKKLPHQWLMDHRGNPTDDPEEFYKDPPATVLPLGGLDTGYKGFALGILVEALTNALGGFGRSSDPDNWGSSVFLQIIDPEAFGGKDFFNREMQYFSDACKNTETRPGDQQVRLPGARALRLRDKQKEEGVRLYPSILPGLLELSQAYQVELPQG